MTKEEAAKWLEQIREKYICGGDEKFDELRKEAINIAISVLRAQQTPAKLDRSRWKGCEWCRKARPLKARLELGYQYCEHCGRPLTEEAWAELEGRIGGKDETADECKP